MTAHGSVTPHPKRAGGLNAAGSTAGREVVRGSEAEQKLTVSATACSEGDRRTKWVSVEGEREGEGTMRC